MAGYANFVCNNGMLKMDVRNVPAGRGVQLSITLAGQKTWSLRGIVHRCKRWQSTHRRNRLGLFGVNPSERETVVTASVMYLTSVRPVRFQVAPDALAVRLTVFIIRVSRRLAPPSHKSTTTVDLMVVAHHALCLAHIQKNLSEWKGWCNILEKYFYAEWNQDPERDIRHNHWELICRDYLYPVYSCISVAWRVCNVVAHLSVSDVLLSTLCGENDYTIWTESEVLSPLVHINTSKILTYNPPSFPFNNQFISCQQLNKISF